MSGYSVTPVNHYCLVGILDYVHLYSGRHPMLRRMNTQLELGPFFRVGYETKSSKMEAHKASRIASLTCSVTEEYVFKMFRYIHEREKWSCGI